MQNEDSNNLSDFPKHIRVSDKKKNQVLYVDEFIDIMAIWLYL